MFHSSRVVGKQNNYASVGGGVRLL